MKNLALCLAAAAMAAAAAPAHAAYVIDIQQVGSDVVGTGSGSVDLRGLAYLGTFASHSGLVPSTPTAILGVGGFYSAWGGTMTGPGAFGPGDTTIASSTAGPVFGFDLVGTEVIMAVPLDYISGTALGQSIVSFADATFASLGVTEGTYVYSWGAGANADSLTLRIGTQNSAVPEPGTWAMMLAGFCAIGAVMRRSRSRAPSNLSPCDL